MTVHHTFVSGKADGGDSTLVQPSNWNAAHTVDNGSITRAMLGADASNWSFLGTANGATVTVGPVTTTSTFRQFMIHYIITGYSASAVGRLVMGAGTPSTSALTNGSSLREVSTASATDVATAAQSIPGIPLAVTVSNIARDGWILIDGASGSFKSIRVVGQNGNPSVSVAPTLFDAAGWFSDLSTNLPLKQFQLTSYATLATTTPAATTFTANTALWVWARNGD